VVLAHALAFARALLPPQPPRPRRVCPRGPLRPHHLRHRRSLRPSAQPPGAPAPRCLHAGVLQRGRGGAGRREGLRRLAAQSAHPGSGAGGSGSFGGKRPLRRRTGGRRGRERARAGAAAAAAAAPAPAAPAPAAAAATAPGFAFAFSFSFNVVGG
jgi:hypothetical protein